MAESGEPDLPASVGEGDEHGHEPGDECSDERDERAHEHEHGERKGERQGEEPQSEPDEHRVDCRDERRTADEAAEDLPGSLPGEIDGRPRLRREALQDPLPELRAVPKNEVEDCDGQDQSREEVDSGLDARSGVAGSLLPGICERRLEVLGPVEGEVERLVLQSVRDVVDGARDGVDEPSTGQRTDAVTIAISPATTASPARRASAAAGRSSRSLRREAATGVSAGAIVSATMIGRTITFRNQSTVSAARTTAAQASRRHDHPAARSRLEGTGGTCTGR